MSPRSQKLCSRVDGGSTATLPPPVDANEIARRVSASETERQLAEAKSAVERWRKIVADVASGVEPDGRVIADIGELVRFLRLPSDALAIHVAAYQENDRLERIIESHRDELKTTRSKNDEIAAEVKRLEARLAELRLVVQKYHATANSYPSLLGARNEHQSKSPVLFADVDAIVSRMHRTQNSRGLQTFSATAATASPSPVSVGSWES